MRIYGTCARDKLLAKPRGKVGSIGQTYRKSDILHFSSQTTVYAPRLAVGEQVRRLRARIAHRLETLSPFWTAFALTLTECVGASILALPIALAQVGPLVGVVLLVALGAVNILTIAALSEVIARNGSIRYGHAYFGRVVAEYLGSVGTVVMTAALLTLVVLVLILYYVGVASTLASASGVPAVVWAALLFLVHLYYLRRKSLNATIASALLVGAINIGLIMILSALALPHLRAENLLRVGLPFVGDRPFDASILTQVFGVIAASYYGHTSVGNCAKVVLRRDGSGRALLWGATTAVATAGVIYCLWIMAVNGAVTPSALARQSGTALVPLAATIGPLAYLFGTVYVALSMGMISVHMALALHNQTREWLASLSTVRHEQQSRTAHLQRWRAIALHPIGRSWLGIMPLVAILMLVEWLLVTGKGSFTAQFAFLGTITVSLLGGIFPVLLLAASRRKGEHLPGTAVRFLGHPAALAGLYLFFVSSILLHGLLIWQDPFQRAAALLTGVIILVATGAIVCHGAFRPRAVVELRVDRWADGLAHFNLVGRGRSMPSRIHLRHHMSEESLEASEGMVVDFQTLQSASFALPPGAPREVKVWAHQVTREGDSLPLRALLAVRGRGGLAMPPLDLACSGGQIVLPSAAETAVVELLFE